MQAIEAKRRAEEQRGRLWVSGWSGGARAAVILASALLPWSAGCAEYWQARRPGATIIVEGDRAFAESGLTRLVQLQETARLLFDWPADHRPSTVLAFVVDVRRIRDAFAIGPRDRQGNVLATGGLTLVVAPIVHANRRQFEEMQSLYGSALAADARTVPWSDCALLGFGAVFMAAEYTGANHLYLGESRILPVEPQTPEHFLGEPAFAGSQIDIDRRTFSCFVLDEMYVTGTAETRTGIVELFRALSSGASLESAIPAALGGTLPEFSMRYRAFFDRRYFGVPYIHSRPLDFKAELSLPDPIVVDTEQIPEARLRALLSQVCAKMSNCRTK